MKSIVFVLGLVLFWSVGACQPAQPSVAEPESNQPVTLLLASHDSFSISEDVITEFETANNVELRFLTLGDAGEALNKIILSKQAPLADVFVGVDNTFLSRALDADIFVPYASPLLAAIPDDLEIDPDFHLLPVDSGYVNINADRIWFDKANLPLPDSLEDLASPEYADLLVVQNPATSSPGLAFLLTTISYFGEDGYLGFWQQLLDNGVLVTDGWSEAYFEHFTVGSAGTGNRPLVVSYSTSPPADVLYADDGRTEPASVNVSPAGGTFRQIEFVGIIDGTDHIELAQNLVDFMLDRRFQEDVPLQMFVYPANENAELPDLFTEFGQIPDAPAEIAPTLIEENRETWIEDWTNLMLR